MVKNPPAGDARDVGSILGLERSPGNGNLLHYACLKNSMDRGAWRATAHGVTKLFTAEQLNTHAHTHTHTHTNHCFRVCIQIEQTHPCKLLVKKQASEVMEIT